MGCLARIFGRGKAWWEQGVDDIFLLETGWVYLGPTWKGLSGRDGGTYSFVISIPCAVQALKRNLKRGT